MLTVVNGIVMDARVTQHPCPLLNKGPLGTIHAIVMHQTASSTAASTLAAYEAGGRGGDGAHFLLDKDGTMYQCVPVNRRCNHVGAIKPRCIDEKSCTKVDNEMYKSLHKTTHSSGGIYNRYVSRYETKKEYPVRYPWNGDSIGIEVVGLHIEDTKEFEGPTPQQTTYLHWFVADLMKALGLADGNVYRHPMLSAKTEGEARGVTW